MVVLDGGVGAGKSTVMRYIQFLLLRESVAFASIDEPVAAWRLHGLLDAMYRELLSLPSFQYMSLVDRFLQLINALGAPNVPDLFICERSPRSDASTFALMGVPSGAETR